MPKNHTDLNHTTCYLIANPFAGNKQGAEIAKAVQTWFYNHGLTVQLALTTRKEDAIHLAQNAIDAGIKQILSLGGDGTSFEVINGIMRSTQSAGVTLGIMPCGTGNDFIRDFGITSWQQVAQAVIENCSSPFDVIRLSPTDDAAHSIYFHNTAGFGAIADISHQREVRFRSWKKLGYHAALFSKLFSFKTYTMNITLDDGERVSKRTPLLVVCNSQYTGHKMHLSPRSNVNDGYMEVIYTDELSPMQLLKLFVDMSFGRHLKNPLVHTAQVKSIDIDVEGGTQMMLDGDILPNIAARLEVVPSALWLYA